MVISIGQAAAEHLAPVLAPPFIAIPASHGRMRRTQWLYTVAEISAEDYIGPPARDLPATST